MTKYDGILFGDSSLVENGLSTSWGDPILRTTSVKEMDGVLTEGQDFFYLPDFDTVHYIKANMKTKLGVLGIPTAERALVDCMRYLDLVREDYFVEGLQDYIRFNSKGDLSKLYEVSDFYGVSRETLEYWIKEAMEYRQV